MQSLRDIMSEGVECVEPDTPVQEAAQRMKSLDVGALPVCRGEKLEGILTDRDIVLRAISRGKELKDMVVEDIMTTDVETVRASDSVDKASKIMRRHQIRRLPVVDSKGHVTGIVSLGDIATEGKSGRMIAKTLRSISSDGIASKLSTKILGGILVSVGVAAVATYLIKNKLQEFEGHTGTSHAKGKKLGRAA